jgi:zinc protease
MMRTYERAYNERDKTDSGAYVAEYMRNFLEANRSPASTPNTATCRNCCPASRSTKSTPTRAARFPATPASWWSTPARPRTPARPTGDAAAGGARRGRAGEVIAARGKGRRRRSLMDASRPRRQHRRRKTRDKALGTDPLTLSNGVKVILKPTDFRNDQVLMSAARFGGQSLFDDADIVNARYATPSSPHGPEGLSPLDMRKVLAGKAAAVTHGLGNRLHVVAGTAGATDIETMLQMVWLRFDGVRRDEDLYKSFIGKQIEAGAQPPGAAGRAFGDTVVATLYNNNPRAPRALRPEDFAQHHLDRASRSTASASRAPRA